MFQEFQPTLKMKTEEISENWKVSDRTHISSVASGTDFTDDIGVEESNFEPS